MHAFSTTADRVLHPRSIHRVADVNSAPKEKGIYGWLFTPGSLPVPDAPYAKTDGLELMYVGIAPRKPNRAGKESSSQLRVRLSAHARRDASRSTLRLTLGLLLAEELCLSLGTYGGRLNWGPEGEARLTRWMNTNARVAWVENQTPWVAEDELLTYAPLALNIDGRTDAFSHELNGRRTKARSAARNTHDRD